ncbi:hypothetical protein Y10_30920 [Neptunitalea sp. Y10]|uniref:Uncharacterized protein n=1 Tax=Neptunitalea lumnitzerae TaxID=2965509 RepID=A0ABQ5MMW7_9FLAO|nr:hypothetical protein Y10_30920 [Neptunitalea sp. Y10]
MLNTRGIIRSLVFDAVKLDRAPNFFKTMASNNGTSIVKIPTDNKLALITFGKK